MSVIAMEPPMIMTRQWSSLPKIFSARSTAAEPTEVEPCWMLVPERMAMQGNLDPLALVAGGAALEGAADDILAAMRGRPFVFNLGHGIVPGTPPEHVAALVARVRAAS